MDDMEKCLNSFDPAVRKAALEKARSIVFNLHCHSFFSYNGYGYSPTKLAVLAKQSAWRAVGMGALGGALGGASGLAGSALGVTQAGNTFGYNLLSQTANSIITNGVFGQETKLSDIVGITIGASFGSILPKYKAINAKPIVNTLAETGFNTLRGAAIGAVRGGIDAIIHKDLRYSPIYKAATISVTATKAASPLIVMRL